MTSTLQGPQGQKYKRRLLTVGDTLILDLQVLVCAGAGVGEDIGPGHHRALRSVVASVAGRDAHVS